MKRLLLYLSAVMAFLALSQNAMADDVFLLTGSTLNGVQGAWKADNAPEGHKLEWLHDQTYRLTITELPSDIGTDGLWFRIGVKGWGDNDFHPQSNGDACPVVKGGTSYSDDEKCTFSRGNDDRAWHLTLGSADYDVLQIYIDYSDYDAGKVWAIGWKKTVSVYTERTLINNVMGDLTNPPAEHTLSPVEGSTTLYKLDIDCYTTSKGGYFYCRVGVNFWDKQMQPENDNDVMLLVDEDDSEPTSDQTPISYGSDNFWYVKNFKRTSCQYNTLTLYVDISSDNRRVWVVGHNTKVELTKLNGRLVRTYSTDEAQYLIGGDIDAYTAYKYVPPTDPTDPTAKGKLLLRKIQEVPANMGVLLVGSGGDECQEGGKKRYMLRRIWPNSLTHEGTDLWALDHKGDEWNNYFVPTVQSTTLNMSEEDGEGNVLWRNFGLSTYHRTRHYQATQQGDDYIGFFRIANGVASGDNKAYLRLPADKTVGDGVGAKFGCLDFNGQFIGGELDDFRSALARMVLVFDDEPGSDPTGISDVEAGRGDSQSDAWFNLQGMRVDRPAKGIYIHNGRKVAVK